MPARSVFIVLFRHQLNGVSPGEIALCLGYGLRISLKTAGMMTAIGLLLSTVPHIVFPRWPAARLRLFWQAVVLVFFTLCFFIRIPYYQTFDSAFDMMLINGLYDDAGAIWDTIVEDYQPFWRLSAAAMTAGGSFWACADSCIPGLSRRSRAADGRWSLPCWQRRWFFRHCSFSCVSAAR